MERPPFDKKMFKKGCFTLWICASGIGLAVMIRGVAVFYRVIELRLVP